ncbi:alpha/beta hydrolase [Nocardioides sp.]|uniref:alpha/beta hydrolase n=1 Tax=Nocardioides sp. TaxID=35761 RepID=UPI0035283389
MPSAAAGTSPGLTRLDAPGVPRGVVLALHGGRPRSRRRVDGRSASWRLMLGLTRALAQQAEREAVSVWTLRYRHRGWNGGVDPIEDARWALAEVRRELGEVPVVLLGHSMGARAALHVADDPVVAGVVALAPWIEGDTPVDTLTGRRLVAAHGRRDRLTSYAATRAYVDRATAVARSARFVDMGDLGHYLIRGHARWAELARSESLRLLA